MLRAGGLLFVGVFILGTVLLSTIYKFVIQPGDFWASVLPSVLVDLANGDRKNVAVASLKVNPLLEEAARLKAKDMAEKGYFAHYSPEGASPWQWINKAGYKFVYAGENLAINFDDSESVNNAWMNSPGHRANILNGHFTEIGIATAKGMYQGMETIFVVQMFGSPAKEAPVAVQDTNPAPNIVEDTSNNEVLGETFMSVKNESAVPQEVELEQSNTAKVDLSTPAEKLITSPTKFLGIAYSVLAALLGLVFIITVRKNYPYRVKNTVSIIVICIFIIATFYFYTYQSENSVTLPLTFAQNI